MEVPNLDVNVQNKSGITALIMASESDKVDCLELLLKSPQLNCNIQAANGSTALSRACSKSKKACVNLLLQRDDIDINIKDNEGFSALATAASRNATDCLFLLLDHHQVNINSTTLKGDSVLMIAMKVGNMHTINRLLTLPIDYKVQNSVGESALYIACSVGNKESVNLLLSMNDIDVNMCTSTNVTPLMKACEGCYYDIIELLLKRPEILVNVKNDKGSNALMLAINSRSRFNPELKLSCVKKILSFPGLDINDKDNDNNTALMLAAKTNELDIIEALLNVEAIECSGTIFNEVYTLIKTIEDDNIELMKRLLMLPDIDVNIQDDDEKATALTTAVVKGKKAVVDILLSVPNININITNSYGTTALMLACREGEFDIMNLLLSRPEVELNLRNEDGKCALFRACEGDEKKEGILLLSSLLLFLLSLLTLNLISSYKMCSKIIGT
jgi:ankyrin repeat protein